MRKLTKIKEEIPKILHGKKKGKSNRTLWPDLSFPPINLTNLRHWTSNELNNEEYQEKLQYEIDQRFIHERDRMEEN